METEEHGECNAGDKSVILSDNRFDRAYAEAVVVAVLVEDAPVAAAAAALTMAASVMRMLSVSMARMRLSSLFLKPTMSSHSHSSPGSSGIVVRGVPDGIESSSMSGTEMMTEVAIVILD